MEQPTEKVAAKDIKPGDIIQYSSKDVVTFRPGDLVKPLEGEVIHIYSECDGLIFATASGQLKCCSRNRHMYRVQKSTRTPMEMATMRSNHGATMVKSGLHWVSID